jgi:DNA polymerase V
MKRPIFVLIDCNNFFVSCQRLFRPDLEGKPVVVLSSNDGCVVARSNEAKLLGIPMGAPAFKWRNVFERYHVVQFSGNFELYGDISRRITQLLTSMTPRIEVYSVDESFLDLSQLKIKDYTAWGRAVRADILRYIGIPVSIGIAPTKTLAKLASDHAKKVPEYHGALSMIDIDIEEHIAHLQRLPLKDVWGIGWRLSPQLQALGVNTAYDLSCLSTGLARQLMGVHGEHLVYELNGTSCLPLELEGKARQSIARTRTFGEDVTNVHVIEAAIASFAAKAAFRLRESHQLTRRASLFLATNKHKPGYRRWGREVHFAMPTADTGLITEALVRALGKIYDQRAAYYRAGVMLYDFVPASVLQTDLLGDINVKQHRRSVARMKVLDYINERYGKHHLYYAAEDLGHIWEPRQSLRSPRYTSRWEELPAVKLQI